MCLYPKLIRNKKYTYTKKNGGNIPPVSDERTLFVAVGCGRCQECMKKKGREWQIRMIEEIKRNKNGRFVTFTFSNESIKELKTRVTNDIWIKTNKIWNRRDITEQEKEKLIKKNQQRGKGYALDNAIATMGVRAFLERWRKKYKNMKDLKHWLVTELGGNGTENIHLHGIIWTTKGLEEIKDRWQWGFIWPRNEEEWKKNYVGEITVNYVIKYMTKVDMKHKGYIGKVLCSAGIGKGYEETFNGKQNRYNKDGTYEGYRMKDGRDIGLPIYYRNKIYSEEEREQLWIEKLDKQERWVNGIRIDVSKSMKEYYRVLEYEQKRSTELGFSKNITWKESVYEEQRREMMMAKRIGNES